MITYNRSAFGWKLFFIFHGSAIYRSVLPALVAVAIYFIYDTFIVITNQQGERDNDVLHPYAVGVLVTSSTFLIVFRLNQSYSRYWEACGNVHHFMSKWLDATTHTSIYHMQCDHYNRIKPPVFYDHPELNFLFMTRDRERNHFSSSQDDTSGALDHEAGLGLRNRRHPQAVQKDQVVPEVPPPRGFGGGSGDISSPRSSGSGGRFGGRKSLSDSQAEEYARKMRRKEIKAEYAYRASVKSINKLDSTKYKRKATKAGDEQISNGKHRSVSSLHSVQSKSFRNMNSKSFESSDLYEESVFHQFGSEPVPLVGKPRLDGGWGEYYTINPNQPLSTYVDPLRLDSTDGKGFASTQGSRSAPLFLQELAHLSSLLTAVALSTLRNDIDGMESPLSIYEPGQPWPEVDSTKDEILNGKGWGSTYRQVKNFLGFGLTSEQRSARNAAQPLPVIGGVSDAEIRFLQMARGPYAKTQLCFNWLSEFVVREHLAGSLGAVGPPIISRVFQFLGDGMIYYNHARKIMFVPFPFGHAQLSIFYVYVMKIVIPYLMHEWTDHLFIGAFLTFLTVLCIEAINEVARDLENPFRNFPNELPLVNIMAQFNEGLITMYAGYHPDAFWDGDQVMNIALSSGRSSYRGKQQDNGSQGTESHKTSSDGHITKNDTSSLMQREPTFTASLTNVDEGDEKLDVAALQNKIEYQAKVIEELYSKVEDLCAKTGIATEEIVFGEN